MVLEYKMGGKWRRRRAEKKQVHDDRKAQKEQENEDKNKSKNEEGEKGKTNV